MLFQAMRSIHLATGILKEEPAIQAGECFRATATSCQARHNLQLHNFHRYLDGFNLSRGTICQDKAS